MVDYKGELTTKLNDAWQLAREQIKKSQASQKQYYDTFTNEHSIRVGDEIKSMCTHQQRKQGLLIMHVHLWVSTGY